VSVPAALLPALAFVAALPPGSRVAVLGSRGACPALLALVSAFVGALPSSVVVCSGGAGGVDQLAASVASSRGLQVAVFPAAWSSLGRAAGVVRSRQLLAGCAAAVVFWSGDPASSPGSAAALAAARSLGVPVFSVVCPASAGDQLSLWG